ncbi:MAG: DUF2877 domain-containing protein [Candidatus Tenebribacter davisii]|jgi:hypothetical protein|nr:DUF2877 domain-containing protein [Candidatus Tenebribacter davisii]
MEILNFGSSIKNGNYILHSKFKNVHNYIDDHDIISLVTTQIGKGPNNIVLNRIPEIANNTITISKQQLIIGNTALKIQLFETSNDNVYIHNYDLLRTKIEFLEQSIVSEISPDSLGFLLFPGNEVFFTTAFEKAFISHVKNTMQDFSIEKLPEISKKMKGVGFGLTPSGDDFNCGILYALNYLQQTCRRNFSQLIEKCFQNSIGTNLISNTFLKFAYSNQYYENFYKLLKALKLNCNDSMIKYAEKIINSGHTSGSDMLTGFILTMKGVLNDKKFS